MTARVTIDFTMDHFTEPPLTAPQRALLDRMTIAERAAFLARRSAVLAHERALADDETAITRSSEPMFRRPNGGVLVTA